MNGVSGQSIGIIALKGGVGKTSVTSNLGAILTRDFGKKVIIIDANFSTPHLGLSLGLVNPRISLQDVLNGKFSIYESINIHPSGFHVIGGRANKEKISKERINPYRLKEEVDRLRKFYDIILIDSSPAMNEEVLSTMISSDKLIAVSTPDYITLASTIHAIKIAKGNKTPINGIVLNKVRNKNFEITPSEISCLSGIPVLSVLNEDVKVLKSLSECMPCVLNYPKGKISKAYRILASGIIEEPYGRRKSNVLRYLKGTPQNIYWKLKNSKDSFIKRRKLAKSTKSEELGIEVYEPNEMSISN